MSDAGRIREIAPEFLRVAYEISLNEPSEIVTLDQVAEHISLDDLGTGGSDYVDKLTTVAQYLGRRGLLGRQTTDWRMFTVTQRGIDEAEGNKPEPQSTTTNINISGPVQGSVIGTNTIQELTNNFDFRSVEQRIESEGGEDKEELREALAEVRRLLESGNSMERGFLSRFSGAMQRHEWFTGSVMQGLAGFATQVAVGG